MADDDDLGSFFSELQEVEQKISAGDIPVEAEPVAAPPIVEKIIAAPVVQVVAKPQVIEKSARYVEVPATSYAESASSVVSDEASEFGDDEIYLFCWSQEPWNEVSAFENASAYAPSDFTYQQDHVQPVAQPFIPIQQNKKYVRTGGGEVWVDPTLNEWPENDFRLFVGDLGNEVTTDALARQFQEYKSFAKAKVVRGGWNSKSRGYGFVSFLDPFDCAKALREQNGKYLGNR
jgi:hypothetical protein